VGTDVQTRVSCPHCLAGEPSVWDTVLFRPRRFVSPNTYLEKEDEMLTLLRKRIVKELAERKVQ